MISVSHLSGSIQKWITKNRILQLWNFFSELHVNISNLDLNRILFSRQPHWNKVWLLCYLYQKLIPYEITEIKINTGWLTRERTLVSTTGSRCRPVKTSDRYLWHLQPGLHLGHLLLHPLQLLREDPMVQYLTRTTIYTPQGIQ